ncbi:interleukin-17C [Salminus brasiliensis]|uniref:interleukin-17C n=1 Tax=Salminus brasiliensis TaxID=930266 RepID=UPI003B830C45
MWSPLFYGVVSLLFAGIAAMYDSSLISCLPEDKLVRRAKKLLARSGGKAAERVTGGAAGAQSCSEFSRMHFSAEPRNRSLSPWVLILKDVFPLFCRSHPHPDTFPDSYQVAKCLCSGCIINGIENMDYNSVEVNKTMMFLKKVPCELNNQGEKKYSLQIEYKTLPVACTCVVPKQ